MNILVELDGGPNNGNVSVTPVGELFRGRHIASRMNEPQKTQPENMGIPETVPGFHIELDLRKRKVTIYDPLSRPEYKRDRAALESYLSRQARRPVQGKEKKFSPREDIVVEIPEHDASTMMAWLLFLYRICTAKTPSGILHSGQWPREVVDYASDLQKEAANAMRMRTTKLPVPELASV